MPILTIYEALRAVALGEFAELSGDRLVCEILLRRGQRSNLTVYRTSITPAL
jgi:hypothetical protein